MQIVGVVSCLKLKVQDLHTGQRTLCRALGETGRLTQFAAFTSWFKVKHMLEAAQEGSQHA
jgi:hypothetical protein